MNSLNILSARVIGSTPPSTPASQRARSFSEGSLSKENTDVAPKRSASQHVTRGAMDLLHEKEANEPARDGVNTESLSDELSEKEPLLAGPKPPSKDGHKYNKLRLAAKRLVDALTKSLKWVLSTLTSPGVYIVTGFYDDNGKFSSLLPLRKFGQALPKRNGRNSTARVVGLSMSTGHTEHVGISSSDAKSIRRKASAKKSKRKLQGTDSFSPVTSESETDIGQKTTVLGGPNESRLRPQTSSSSEETPQARRSIRIKLYNEKTTRRRRQRQNEADSDNDTSLKNDSSQPAIPVTNIKSPTSPASSSSRTKYSHAPAPPRPLIPRQQPSHSMHTSSHSFKLAHKTLVIDLDETLIHSLAKGGRMSSGHMVEVKLNMTVGYGGATLGPQHPILYYVHKRPHCDDFLRKVCKWYNLVVFTASVQEYADPVIDWLEQERKYFSGRYYRQHCTFRNGAYVKDLSSVEPDLSKVMILDNSPLSYIFHEGKSIAKDISG